MHTIVHDSELRLDAYLFDAMKQTFPNHFHEYYVIGLIETGERRLKVRNREYVLGPGDMILFNPSDNHACEQSDGGHLTYRCLNIKIHVMADVYRETCGHDGVPRFLSTVLTKTDAATLFRELHRMIMAGDSGLEKEEAFLLFMRQLCSEHAEPSRQADEHHARENVETVCAYLEEHYAERVTLDDLAHLVNLNKFTLLRIFAREKGVTPYRYLVAIRIDKAKLLLEQGGETAMAALRTGFADQSHFTRFFRQFIGLSPGQYQAVFRKKPDEK